MAEGARSSLQRRLFGWLMLPLLVALPVLGTALYEQVRHSAQSWLDEGLEDTALTLAGQIDVRGGEPRIGKVRPPCGPWKLSTTMTSIGP